MKIAVFCPNWVGDLVMATPALRALRTKYAHAEIVAVLRPYVADVLTGLNLVDRILLHSPRAGRRTDDRSTAGWRFARQLRSERFEAVLLFPNSFRSAWWARLSGARRRVGFDRNGRGWLLTDRIAPKPREEPHPAMDDYLRLVSHFGCEQLTRRMELATTPDDEQQLRSFWARQPPNAFRGRGVVCLNPGGAFGSAKHWPVASFAELAKRLAHECEKRVLVLCGPAERDEAAQIAALAGHPGVVSLAKERLSLGLTKAAVRNCELLITTDSGPRHFAPPFQVPVVTLFGPTHTAWSETYYDKALHLQLELDCGPCQQRVCPLQHHRCMRDLGVDWVMRAAMSMLDKYPTKREAA